MITQGKWKAEPWSKKEGQVVAHHDGKRHLICGGVLNDDAHLIAAAPDLLAALEALVDKSTDTEGDWSNEWRAALDAIAKSRNTPALHVEVL